MLDTSSPSIICKSCGNIFHGNYCSECGEEVLKSVDRSLKTLVGSVVTPNAFTHSKPIKTLWLVLSKPGFVSSEYIEGRRVNYMKLTSLFFVLNLIYFFFPLIQLFNATLHTQLLSPLGELFKNVLVHKIIDMGLNLGSFQLIYDEKTVGYAELMVMVFVIIASLPLNFLYCKKNRFFTDHVEYMIEWACFNLFVNTIALSILAYVGLGKYLNETVLTVIFISTNFYFLLRSGNIFYRERSWKLVLKSVLMIAFLKVSLEVYRAILFFVTIWSI